MFCQASTSSLSRFEFSPPDEVKPSPPSRMTVRAVRWLGGACKIHLYSTAGAVPPPWSSSEASVGGSSRALVAAGHAHTGIARDLSPGFYAVLMW